MKKNKMSKLLLCMLTALFLGVVGTSAASATSHYQSHSVREMMDRRRNALPHQRFGVVQPERIVIRQTSDGRMQRSILRPQLSCSKSPKKVCKRSTEREVSIEVESEPTPLMPTLKRKRVYKTAEHPLPMHEPVALSKREVPVEDDLIVQDLDGFENRRTAGDVETFVANVPQKKSRGGIFSFLFPKDKDGSLFPGGGCENCQKSGPLFDTGPCPSCDDGPLLYAEPCESCGALIDDGPCEKCEEPLLYAEPCESCPTVLEPGTCESCPTVLPGGMCDCAQQVVAPVEMPDCCSLAPLYLAHVDFNLGDGGMAQTKVGDYRFRIFGCRRYDRNAVLNQGRILQKNMDFAKVFEQTTGDCYNIVKLPDDLCLQKEPSPLPEYILTAEINNVYMDICDGYDWDNAKASGTRSGSAEITVNWKLSNLTRDKILWQGTTTGYADLRDGVENGEIQLIEDAFADATSTLRMHPEFEAQLAKRLTPEELTAERQALIDEEVALDPAKCNYKPNFDQCTPQAPCEVVDDAWAQTQVVDTMCIIDRPPYESLTPENLYKVRASVVEINAPNGKKGAGLIISENFVLTSADLADNEAETVWLKTINGKGLTGRIVRVNTGKNIALIKLDEPTEYTPLSLNLDLPRVDQTGFMVLGMLNVDNFADGENYIDNKGKVTGYRYSEDKGTEIMLDTDVQNMTIGGVLVDEHGTINGVAHTGQKTENGKDLFLPTETALRSVGLSICEKLYDKPSPWQRTVSKAITIKIMDSKPQAPEALPVAERK